VKKLLLCSGPRQSPYGEDGWFRVDSNPVVRPDLLASVPPIPYELRERGPWDIIALIHGIEHFYRWEAPEVMRGCWELLSPGGQLILEQPNLEKCMDTSERSMLGLYGEQSYKEPTLVHRWAYTPDTLTELALQAGFAKTVIEPARFHFPPRDFRLVAIR
jgi:predicted SAM-dependent methyltransferase